jgi:hypothetical protein
MCNIVFGWMQDFVNTWGQRSPEQKRYAAVAAVAAALAGDYGELDDCVDNALLAAAPQPPQPPPPPQQQQQLTPLQQAEGQLQPWLQAALEAAARPHASDDDRLLALRRLRAARHGGPTLQVQWTGWGMHVCTRQADTCVPARAGSRLLMFAQARPCQAARLC